MKSKIPFRKMFWRQRYLYLMLLPAIIYVIVFSYLPMAGIVLAFKKFNYQLGIFGSKWVNFQNFRFLFMSDKLWPLTRNTLLYNLAFIVLGMFLEVTFAIAISELTKKYFKKLFQSLMFLPYFVSWVVVAAIMAALFSKEAGLVNNILSALGMNKIDVYASAKPWPFLLVMFRLWKNTGYGSIVYLATVTGIDPEMYDAASIDGANIWKRIRYITIPHLIPTMAIMFMLAVGQIFRGDFGLFYQLIGHNALIREYADILDLFVFRALQSTSDIGQASAAGLYQSVLCFVTISVVNFIIRKVRPDYALY